MPETVLSPRRAAYLTAVRREKRRVRIWQIALVAGLGYLIVYGSQVFNMDLVMASVMVLGLAAVGMYLLVLRAETFLNHLWGVRT